MRDTMLRNYLVLALRRLRRERAYAGINILGLSVAVACVLLVVLYASYEFSFDAYHEKVDRIYRVVSLKGPPEEQSWESMASGLLAPELRASFPEVEDAVRMQIRPRGRTIEAGGGEFHDVQVAHSESNVFSIFSFPLVAGDPRTALDRPYTAVVTRRLAERLFGGEDPIGKTIEWTFLDEGTYEITGVAEDVPKNSHFTFDLLVSFESLVSPGLIAIHGAQFDTYLLAREGTDVQALTEGIQRWVHSTPDADDTRLQRLTDIHFSDVYGAQGDEAYLRLLAFIAGAILLIACANYMNLATARSAQRGREVGVRKALGARRAQLVRQFLVESVLLVLLALPLALVLLSLALPLFNELVQAEVSLDWGSLKPLIAGCAGVMLLVGLIGGSYPALYLSAFDPVQVLKGQLTRGISSAALRRGVVVWQFTASMLLIVATGVVLGQIRFMQRLDLGFDADQVVYVRVTDPSLVPESATLKEEFLRTPNVVSATAGLALPGQEKFSGLVTSHTPEGDSESEIQLASPTIDADFLETMQIPLVAGRNIREEVSEGESRETLLNTVAVRAMGWSSLEEALGKTVAGGVVVGVVEDFHFKSLHHEITPLLMQQSEGGPAPIIALRLRGGEIPATLAGLERTWERIAPGAPFEYAFLRDELNVLYEREQRAAKVFGLFAGLAILIACMGLFGLAAFTAEQRRKEIGIRKVLGASATGLVALLSRDFVKLVAIAVVLASPLAYFLMRGWLEDFAYRYEIGFPVFALSAGLLLVITLAVVGHQGARAAAADPVKSLRYE